MKIPVLTPQDRERLIAQGAIVVEQPKSAEPRQHSRVYSEAPRGSRVQYIVSPRLKGGRP